ncbi:MAG: hypothetical protein HETSPECPRED_004351 [Heterodermia speciosa]|uniref:IQ calmodulin-binding motif domain protein n=1 Tax=Heterodermia speciosa TaxID=116794 RepID=A0A8H3FAF3_9LECA|nr:MAG: hypothetical protein HETSPECPRED_004351 [Heterodermia speciosa]
MSGLDRDINMSSDSEGLGDYGPPPHIRARFYRSSTNTARRKSSAASSRRNSMSSHHSSRSARSAHGGPQSTHIAQHLRRASLLESRKARLAEKAAHAEKVRLRAAMAKAAPRVNANSEERALAAQQAREKYLAQVAANCHEEVKRAKRVAEDTREKKAAEHLRLKGEMEERLAEAEKRRIVYQQNLKRSRHNNGLAPVEEKKVMPYVWKPRNDDEAAKVLQRAWRNMQWRKGVSEFHDLGLSLDAVGKASFDEVGILLSQERALTSTARILRMCCLQDNESMSANDKTTVRTFLSGFLILGHPKQVLSNDGVQEQDLVAKAKILIEIFEALISNPSFTSFLPTQLNFFQEAYSSFQSAFSAWKAHDSSILVGTMIAQFVELDAIWQSVKDDTSGEVSGDYREGIQQNQTLILVRLKRLLGHGEAMKLVRDAIKEARRAKSRKKKTKPVKEARPRAALTSTALPQGRENESHNSDTKSLAWAHHAHELRKATTSLPDNRAIMHELAINQEYRIDLAKRADTKESILQAVSEDIREGLSSGLGDIWIVAMAQTVRDKLLGLLQPGASLYTLISDALDPSVIANQVRMGAFSYQQFFSFLNTLLPKLCAPVRDAEVKALAEDPTEDPIERFAKVNYVIDLLSLDNANFTLQIHAPLLLEQAPSYEQNCFTELFGDKPLTNTTEWWRRASRRAREDVSRRAGDNARIPNNRITPNRVYMQGLVDLAVAVTPLQESELPETLELDHDRIVRIKSDVLRMITVEAILLTAKNLLKRDVRSQWKAEAQRMWDLPYDDSQAFLSALPQAMPPSSKTALSGTIERVLQDARARQATHPVMKVLLQKIKSHVLTRLSVASADERIKATTTASEVLASGGLSEIVSQVGSMIDELRKVADVDREAHGKWYDEIAGSTLI